jgi:hypothetical protein
MGIKPNYPVKRGQKLSFYVNVIRWISCGSIGFGSSPKMVAGINKNCGESPIGISENGPNSSYGSTGTFSK